MDNDQFRTVWQFPGRSTRVVVDLDAIAGNVKAVQAIARTPRLLAVVKADAYGHGAIAIAKTAINSGATDLGVATVDEAVRLRRAGISAPVVVLGPADESEIDVALDHRVDLAVGDITMAAAIAEAVERAVPGAPAAVHLKVDTGMRRFGADPREAAAIARYIAQRPSLRLRGAFTHYARADEKALAATERQTALFDGVLATLAADGIEPEIVHAANTAAALRSAGGSRQMIRLGIGLYGLAPSEECGLAPGMRPALTWLSRVRRVISLSPGDGVSYGSTYVAKHAEMAALVPVGYADGYRRMFSNLGVVCIGGDRCTVRGRVCMDQTVVGLPPENDAQVGDPVVIAGTGGPTIDELAAWAGTINYEIVTGISARVPRFYLQNGTFIALSDLHGYRALEAVVNR